MLKIPELAVFPARPAISQQEVLAELQITRVTLNAWQRTQNFPMPAVRLEKRAYFRTAEVCNWLIKNGAVLRLV